MSNMYQGEIVKIYEKMKEEEKSVRMQHKAEIASKYPQISDMENKIGSMYSELALSSLRDIKESATYVANLREKITELRVKETELLVSFGYPMDYLSLKYHCAKCRDTGFIGPEKCSCYKSKLLDILYRNSHIDDLLKKYNFDHYDINIFSNKKGIDEPESAKKNIEKVTSASWNYINSFMSSKENLFFYGTAGTGKTFLTCCIAKELIEKGYWVVYKTSEDLIKSLRKIRFDEDKKTEEDMLVNCDLLIIDDLGSEQITEFSKTEFYNLLNKKLLLGQKMIISTNCALEDLMKSYSERITSRLLGEFTVSKFYGDDLRVKKNFKVNSFS